MARILIIDDEAVIRFTLREILEQAGHEVFEADNGQEGVDLHKREHFDLVITDIIMPKMGGLSTIAKLKRTARVPKIVAISGGGRADGHDYLGRASDLGADRVLAKPFNDGQLLDVIEACMKPRVFEGRQTDTAESVYKRFVPSEFLKMIGVDNVAQAKLGDHVERKVTVLFSDIRSFTTLSENMTPAENFDFINEFFGQLVPVIHENGGLIDKFIGDAVMALFCENADSAIRASLAMLKAIDSLNDKRATGAPLKIGIGINTGMVVMGIVGSKDRMETTVIGDTVNLSSRLETLTKLYGVSLLIGETTLINLRVPSVYSIRFVDRLRVKGKLRPQSVYEVFDADAEALRRAKRETAEIFEKAVAYYHIKEIAGAAELFKQCLAACADDTVARLYLERCEEFMLSGSHEGTGELNTDVEWDDDYLVGIAEVDEQHQELLANINLLSRLVREGDTGKLQDVLNFLGSYTQNHFQTEENLMRRYNYPFINEHIHEHERFIETYLNLRADIESQNHDKLLLLFKIDVFLVDWLIHHTTKVDKHMGKYIRAMIASEQQQ